MRHGVVDESAELAPDPCRYSCDPIRLAACPRGPHVAASVAVGYDEPGRIIPENFIGLSYESAVLASPDYLSPRNLSVMGLFRG